LIAKIYFKKPLELRHFLSLSYQFLGLNYLCIILINNPLLALQRLLFCGVVLVKNKKEKIIYINTYIDKHLEKKRSGWLATEEIL
jgi:hypothetical protein